MFKKADNRAFTLVELLITMTIASFLMLVSVFNFGTFNDRLSVSSASQELAIAIRQAQTYGLNVRQTGVGSGGFNSAYGIYFNAETDNTRYYIFADLDTDTVYDVGNGCGSLNTECIEAVTFRDGVRISEVCAIVSGVEECPPNAAARYLHVTFLRPNPDAEINFTNNGGNIFYFASWPNAKIVLVSRRGVEYNVSLEDTGQVYVN